MNLYSNTKWEARVVSGLECVPLALKTGVQDSLSARIFQKLPLFTQQGIGQGPDKNRLLFTVAREGVSHVYRRNSGCSILAYSPHRVISQPVCVVVWLYSRCTHLRLGELLSQLSLGRRWGGWVVRVWWGV